jgi:hypothetical protein
MTGPVLGEAGHIQLGKNHYLVILVLPGAAANSVGIVSGSTCEFLFAANTRPSFSKVSSCLSGKASSFTLGASAPSGFVSKHV